MLLFFLPPVAEGLLWITLLLSTAGLFSVFASQLLFPYLRRKESGIYDPPDIDDSYAVVVDEMSRVRHFIVGKKSGDLTTRCTAIAEDHLDFMFKKSRDAETYDIIIKRNGPVLFRPPRMDTFHKMESVETLESHEIIGHNAQFRISDKLVKDRMINYIELTLSSEFFFNKTGNERMRFYITVSNIQPGINTSAKNKARLYPFGKGKSKPREEETED